MAPTDIKKKTGLSFATVCTHLQRFIKDGQVKEKNGKYYWTFYYLDMVGDALKVYTQELQNTLARMSRPESIRKMINDGTLPPSKRFLKDIFENVDPNAPAAIDFWTEQEHKESFEHNEKVFGDLRSVFFELAKVLMTIDVGIITAKEDLSNIEVRFRDRKPLWTVLPERFSEENWKEFFGN